MAGYTFLQILEFFFPFLLVFVGVKTGVKGIILLGGVLLLIITFANGLPTWVELLLSMMSVVFIIGSFS